MPAPLTLPWPRDALPKIHVAGRFAHRDTDFKALYRAPTHALHQYDYHAAMRLGDRTIDIAPGDLTISPAGMESRYHLPRPGRHWCIHFQPAPHSTDAAAIAVHLSTGPKRAQIGHWLARISQLHHARHADGAAAARAALLELLMHMALWQPAREGIGRPVSTDPVDRVIGHIHSHLDQSLPVPHLAQIAGLSQNYLARLFRKRTGSTMPGYLLQARIDRARLLLTTTDLPVKNIAASVGLPDAQYFNKQFRRITGRSPTAMRLRSR